MIQPALGRFRGPLITQPPRNRVEPNVAIAAVAGIFSTFILWPPRGRLCAMTDSASGLVETLAGGNVRLALPRGIEPLFQP
jgi:hypothetical protein